jgi:uncharacterized protein
VPGCFLDTSALLKLYHPEPGRDRMLTLAAQPNTRLFISQLSLIEMQSTFAKKVRSGLIDEVALHQLMGAFSFDIECERFWVAALDGEVLAAAEELLRTHAVRRALRTLDALQIATASQLHLHGLADTMVASDDAMCVVAKLEGLAVINPLHP